LERIKLAGLVVLPDYNKLYKLVCDASNTGIGWVLLQDERPIAFISKRFNKAQKNYHTTDRELLAAVHCLKEWRVYITSIAKEGDTNLLITEHKPNATVMSKKQLSPRQIRWMELFQEYPLTWMYESGVSNIADPSSRLPEVVFNHFCFEVLEQDKEDTPDFIKLFNRYLMPQQRSPSVYVKLTLVCATVEPEIREPF
jgi:hypothetical protein